MANFLGQSNLIGRKIQSREGDMTTVDMQGITVTVPRERTHAEGSKGWVGIRPEKVLIGDEGEALDAPGNTIPGGVVTDVSFVGVSTQYLVRMPWGQEIQVFEQNTGRRRIFRYGDEVELSWRPEYAFLLDHDQDAGAGSQIEERVSCGRERDRPPEGGDRLRPARPGNDLADPVLPDPLLLPAGRQPVQQGRVGLPRLLHGLRVEQLQRRDQGTTGRRSCAR